CDRRRVRRLDGRGCDPVYPQQFRHLNGTRGSRQPRAVGAGAGRCHERPAADGGLREAATHLGILRTLANGLPVFQSAAAARRANLKSARGLVQSSKGNTTTTWWNPSDIFADDRSRLRGAPHPPPAAPAALSLFLRRVLRRDGPLALRAGVRGGRCTAGAGPVSYSDGPLVV